MQPGAAACWIGVGPSIPNLAFPLHPFSLASLLSLPYPFLPYSLALYSYPIPSPFLPYPLALYPLTNLAAHDNLVVYRCDRPCPLCAGGD